MASTKHDEEKEERMQTYLEKVSMFKEPELGVSPVLYAIVLTLVSENESENDENVDIITSSYSNESFPLLNSIKTYPPSIALTTDLLLLETDDDQAARYTKANKINDILNSIENMESQQNKYLDLYLFERNAYAQMLINRMIDAEIFPLTPKVTNEERKLRETEVLTFTSLSASDFYRCDKMQVIEDMIQACTAKLPNFSKKTSLGSDSSVTRRRYFRNISKYILPQILSKNIVKEPKILKTYYPHLDELLFVMHWVPPTRRMGNSSWKLPNHIIESNDSKIKSKNKKDKNKRNVLESIKEDTVTITPAGNAIVLTKYEHSTNHSWISIYLNDSIIGLRNLGEPVASPPPVTDEKRPQPDDELGEDEEKVEGINDNENSDDINSNGHDEENNETIKSGRTVKSEVANDPLSNGCSVFLETDDDVRITIFAGPKPETIVKPDKFGTICLMLAMPSLMTITACSNGMVRIATDTTIDNPPITLWGIEVARYISNGGTITRILKDGLYRKDVVAPNGHRYLYKASEDSTKNVLVTEGDGFHYLIQNNYQQLNWHCLSIGIDGTIELLDIDKKPISTETLSMQDDILQVYTDAETLSRVSKYVDGRVITDHTDGLREVVTVDGTRFITHSSGNVVYITKPGFPSIEVDVEIDMMCDGHSKGLQVALSKGGFKVRTRMVCPDGSALMIKYDTRVTAKTNGTLKLVRRDKSVIIANDDGNATYYPRYSWNSNSEKEFNDENSDSTIILDKVTESSQVRQLKSTASTVKFNVEAGLSGVDMNLNASQSTLLHESISNFSASKFKSSIIKDQSISNEKSSKLSKNSKIENTLKENSLIDSSTSASTKETKRKILDAKYKFNIYNYTTSIIDHEYNSFEINLYDPLNPKRSLAGEVQGLKATAISDGPIEPRTFILNRNGDTTEIISSQFITSNEDLVELSSDASKFISDAPIQPADFSSSQQNNYFRRQKLGSIDDSYRFEEIFKERSWHNRKRPATTSLILAKSSVSHSKHKSNKKMELSPRIYDTFSVIERNPLSNEGYKQLYDGMKAYDQFKVNRLDAINRFTIHDPRSSEDIDMELKVRNKVKQSYKTMMKKLEQERRDDEKKDNSNNDDFSAFVDDEEEKKDDPEIIEIKDAFYTYAISPSSTISLSDARLALIQIFNMNIKYDTISSFLDEDSLKVLKTDKNINFSYMQFSDIYFKMKSVILDSDKKISDYSISISDDVNENENSPTTENKKLDSEFGDNSTYWDSTIGKDASLTLPKSATPLHLRPLDWSLNETSLNDDDFLYE